MVFNLCAEKEYDAGETCMRHASSRYRLLHAGSGLCRRSLGLLPVAPFALTSSFSARGAAANFDGRAQHIPFLDHNPPSLRQIKLFCHSVSKWLKQNEKNIVAVHCKVCQQQLRTGRASAQRLLQSLPALASCRPQMDLKWCANGGRAARGGRASCAPPGSCTRASPRTLTEEPPL